MINANQFLILNGVIVTLLLVYFFAARGRPKPSRLNFKKPEVPLKPLLVESAAGETLNVMFQYNGHSFDAYEVLGVPAGSNWEEIQAHYEATSQRLVDPASHEFFRAALNALKSHLDKLPK